MGEASVARVCDSWGPGSCGKCTLSISIILDAPLMASQLASNYPNEPAPTTITQVFMRSIPLCAVLTTLLHVGIASSQYPAAAPAASSAPSVRLGGYLQARETYRDGVGLTGSINRARLTASGGLARNVTWRCSSWQSRKTFADPPSALLSETEPRRAASTSSSRAGRYDCWRIM
jgi:hypothetical protein